MSQHAVSPSTSTAPAAPAAAVPLAPAFGAAALAGPVIVLASSLVWIADLDRAHYVLQFLGGMFLTFGFVAACIPVAQRAPRAASALALLALFGLGGGGMGFAIDGLHQTVFGSPSLADDGGLAGAIAPTVAGLFGPIAIVAIGVAALRTRTLPVATGVLMVVAGAAFPLSRIGEIAPLAAAVDVLLVAALAPIGLRLWRTGRVGG